MTDVYIISGPDAAGKTTQIERLESHLEKQGETVRTAWLRHKHYLSIVPLLLSRAFGTTVSERKGGYTYQYHRFSRCPYLGHLYTACLFIDLTLAFLLFVHLPSQRGRVVICDRGPLDTLTDLRFKTGKDYRGTRMERMFLGLPPAESTTVVFSTSVAELKRRRERLRFERDFEERVGWFRTESDRLGIPLIVTSKSTEEVFRSLLTYIERKNE